MYIYTYIYIYTQYIYIYVYIHMYIYTQNHGTASAFRPVTLRDSSRRGGVDPPRCSKEFGSEKNLGWLLKIVGDVWLYHTYGKTLSVYHPFPYKFGTTAGLILIFRFISTAAHSRLSCICPSGKRTCGCDAEAGCLGARALVTEWI